MNKQGQYIIIKILSGLINIFISLIATLFVLLNQNWFGKGDLIPFILWTIPLAVGLAFSGEAILNLIRVSNLFIKIFLIFIVSAIISFVYILIVYSFLGPWIGAVSFPIFYLWIIGNISQLSFLIWRLPRATERKKVTKLLPQLLLFPLTAITIVMAIYFFSFLKLYITKPDPYLYLIPNNFEGSFRVIYGEKCGIIPPYEDGRRVLQIPENGMIIIQPESETGIIDDEFYLIDEDGNRTELKSIWDFSNKNPDSKGVYRGSSGQMEGIKIYGGRIHYTDFFLFNKNTTPIDNEEFSVFDKKADSLMIEAVNECRKIINAIN